MYTVLCNKKHFRSKGVSVLIDNSGKSYFLTGHSEKGYNIQNVKPIVQGKFCSPLFEHRYTCDQQAPPLTLTGIVVQYGCHSTLNHVPSVMYYRLNYAYVEKKRIGGFGHQLTLNQR